MLAEHLAAVQPTNSVCTAWLEQRHGHESGRLRAEHMLHRCADRDAALPQASLLALWLAEWPRPLCRRLYERCNGEQLSPVLQEEECCAPATHEACALLLLVKESAAVAPTRVSASTCGSRCLYLRAVPLQNNHGAELYSGGRQAAW